ncbi:hypothetical protein RF644_18580 [Kocuria sp. CPCC 205258]|uniref:hypothetical protein n=1 Tax=Kocuria sp. CPCC 205258 TaxID=3073552 RepID=UPI0034D4946D
MDDSSADLFAPREREVGEDDLQIRAGGDMALLQAVSRRVLEAERAAPGTVLDHEFLARHGEGLEALEAHLAEFEEQAVLEAFERDDDTVREHISRVLVGREDYNECLPPRVYEPVTAFVLHRAGLADYL